jgi:hypothetical protein
LRREPQNPLLLLAKATTFPNDHPDREKFKREGFEIARRLQDAKALQAFREEESYQELLKMTDVLPLFQGLDPDDPDDRAILLDALLRKLIGERLSEEEYQEALPQLKSLFQEDDDDVEDGRENRGRRRFDEVDPFRPKRSRRRQ